MSGKLVAGDLLDTQNVAVMRYQVNYYAPLLCGGVICMATKILIIFGLR
jgi:hypothetical protein